MTKLNNKKYISTSAAAKVLKISRVSVFNKIKAGELKAEKIGRNYAIVATDLKKMGSPFHSSENSSARIEKAVDRTVKQYKETLELLGRDEGK